jgi:hypothetical protein
MKIKVHRFPPPFKVFSLYPGIVYVTNIEGTIGCYPHLVGKSSATDEPWSSPVETREMYRKPHRSICGLQELME